MKEQRGFTLTEILIGMMVFFLLSYGLYRSYLFFQMRSDSIEVRNALERFASGIMKNYSLIMEVFEPVCTNVDAGATDDGWGWKHTDCSSTSPLPYWDADGRRLVYSLDLSSLDASQAQSLKDQVSSNLYPLCFYDEESEENTLQFVCDGLVWIRDVYYRTPYSGDVGTFHTPGTELDFLNFPTALVVEYSRKIRTSGETVDEVYEVNLGDLYLYSVNRSREKMKRLVDTLRQYAQTRIVAEFQNPYPDGLRSGDDFFIPWHWQGFGSSIYETCTDDSCSNLQDPNKWVRSFLGFADVWVRILNNLFGGDTSLIVDGFGNPMRLIPIANGCDVDLTLCSFNNGVPPFPGPDYDYVVKPPFVSYVVSVVCLSPTNPYTGERVPDWCRMPVVYGN